MKTVRQVIITKLGRHPLEFDENTVNELERVVLEKCSVNPTGFAYVVARNWVADQFKNNARATRRMSEALLSEEKERKERELLERHVREFDEIKTELMPYLSQAQIQSLGMVYLICFEGRKDRHCAHLFPGTNKNQRYKWKQRGVELLVKHASPELKNFLTKKEKYVTNFQ